MKYLTQHALLLALASFSLTSATPAQQSHIGSLTGDAVRGGDSYKRRCSGCHGARGDGTGTFAPYLDPRPRDMTAGIFKCRSTPTGSMPTDTDLFDTMTRGIVTTAMPPWRPLTPQTRADMVAYIKHFSPRFQTVPPAAPMEVGPETPLTLESLHHGAQLYQKLDCARCHGAQGRGDGPDAGTLTDIKHHPDPPFDFTATSRLKCGVTDVALYRTLRAGMDGSPMESYADKLNLAETWDLVHFVRSLQISEKSPENQLMHKAAPLPAK